MRDLIESNGCYEGTKLVRHFGARTRGLARCGIQKTEMLVARGGPKSPGVAGAGPGSQKTRRFMP